jgi:hypothetical protein
MRGWICHLQMLLALASTVILRSESGWTHDHILLSQIQDSPNLEGQVPVFMYPRKRVAKLYPQALGSLFIASYDSQGYGWGIWPRVNNWTTSSCYTALAQTTKKTFLPLLRVLSLPGKQCVHRAVP